MLLPVPVRAHIYKYSAGDVLVSHMVVVHLHTCVDKSKREITSNSISATFQVLWNDETVAFLSGDLDQVGLDDLLDHGISFAAPILVFPHHGGNTEGYDNISFAKQLCELTKPTAVIFSIGRNKHNNPRPEIVKAIRDAVKEVKISCTQLSKNCAATLPAAVPTHLLSLFSKGREKNECCNGTFIIDLQKGIIYKPDFNLHKNFISEFAPTALCN